MIELNYEPHALVNKGDAWDPEGAKFDGGGYGYGIDGDLDGGGAGELRFEQPFRDYYIEPEVQYD